jgi:hypothetical protein
VKEKSEVEKKMKRLHKEIEKADMLREAYHENLKKNNIPPWKAVAVSDFTSTSLGEYTSGGICEIFSIVQ